MVIAQLILVSSFGPLTQDPAHTAHLHILHNTFCLPSPLPPTKKELHELCWYYSRPKRIERQCLCNIFGAGKVYYGRGANGEYKAFSHDVCWCPKTKERPCCYKPILWELNLLFI